jgi:diguanylate cyclase (GGDEF)-like protein
MPLELPPGRSAVFVRAATQDPLVLPLALVTPEAGRLQQRDLHHGYGLMYGFLLAYVVLTAILFLTLRTRMVLYYGLYLLSFLLMNMGYTGHGLVWWWPQWPGWQRFVVLASMLLFACSGLLFATRFLEFATHAPSVRRGVDRICLAALALMAVFALFGNQLGAAWLAFGFMVGFTIAMVGLSVFARRFSSTSGQYFLVATLFGLVGAASSTLSTLGLLPMTELTFRGVEIGVLIEATLLAVALALRARELDQARRDAELQARTDTLTGLPNRRDFLERSDAAWSLALRRSRPVSVLVLDIDHFKAINDRYGHDAGDAVLVAAAQLLAQVCRASDIPARWGGEEFVLLLPDTLLEQAVALAERLREAIATQPVIYQGQAIAVTASFGAAQRQTHESVRALLAEADQWLYAAKRAGRNRVAASSVEYLGG